MLGPSLTQLLGRALYVEAAFRNSVGSGRSNRADGAGGDGTQGRAFVFAPALQLTAMSTSTPACASSVTSCATDVHGALSGKWNLFVTTGVVPLSVFVTCLRICACVVLFKVIRCFLFFFLEASGGFACLTFAARLWRRATSVYYLSCWCLIA